MEIPRHWRLREQRYRLKGERCLSCGENIFPRRDVCPCCGGKGNMEDVVFSGRGEVCSFTTVYDAAPNGSQVPYVLALVRLEEGPVVTAQITDVDSSEMEIGMQVEMVTRRVGEDNPEGRGLIVYGYKFRPPISSAQ